MKTNRRDFLKTLGGIAAFTIVPRHVLGNGFIAPSDQLTKGIIGTGGMGRGHVNYAGTRLVAVCDVDKNHLELGKQLVKEKIAAYHDFRDLILDPKLLAEQFDDNGRASLKVSFAGRDLEIIYENVNRKDYGSYVIGTALCAGAALNKNEHGCAVLPRNILNTLPEGAVCITVQLI